MLLSGRDFHRRLAGTGRQRVDSRAVPWRRPHGGDAVVTFERANVAHMGDLMFKGRHPIIDRAAGGSIKNWIGVLEKSAADHSNDTVYIFGHTGMNQPVTGPRADLMPLRDYLTALLAFVSAEMKAGKTKEQILANRDPLEGFEDFGPFVNQDARAPLTVGSVRGNRERKKRIPRLLKGSTLESVRRVRRVQRNRKVAGGARFERELVDHRRVDGVHRGVQLAAGGGGQRSRPTSLADRRPPGDGDVAWQLVMRQHHCPCTPRRTSPSLATRAWLRPYLVDTRRGRLGGEERIPSARASRMAAVIFGLTACWPPSTSQVAPSSSPAGRTRWRPAPGTGPPASRPRRRCGPPPVA